MLLDWALGGGYRKGGVVQIYGYEATGKSTLALQCCAEVNKRGGRCLYVDAEYALNETLARGMGVQVDDGNLFAYHAPEYGEKAMEIVERFCKSNVTDLIVVDSVAALIPKNEAAGEVGQLFVGSQARMMSSCLKRIVQASSQSKCTVIFINQTRLKIGVLYGNPETVPGGKALGYYSSQIVRVNKISTPIVKNKKEVGINVRAKVVKNKIANPNGEVEFAILWGKGVDNADQLVDLCEKVGIISRRGGYYYRGDEQLERGKDALQTKLREDPALFQELHAEANEIMQSKDGIKIVEQDESEPGEDDEDNDSDDELEKGEEGYEDLNLNGSVDKDLAV